MTEQSRLDRYFAWYRRIPATLPVVDTPPPAAPGQRHLVHYESLQVTARFTPATGVAVPTWETEGSADAHGFYLPLRSGVLAYYRDEAGRAVVQHRRRRIVVGPGVRCTTKTKSLSPVRHLTFHHDGRTIGRLRLFDTPERWEGPVWARIVDFTWTEPADFDLILAIARDLDGEGPRLI